MIGNLATVSIEDTVNRKDTFMDDLTGRIIGAAIEVHGVVVHGIKGISL